jgi:small-conductance mechanosensitive channel/CRP-like cAMP-binding protein
VTNGFWKLAPPALLTAVAFGTFYAARGAGQEQASSGAHLAYYALGVAAWLTLAWCGTRLADVLVTHAAATLKPTHPPRLLTDLLHAAIYVIAVVAMLVFVFRQEATGLIATSSVLIAVIGFALRNIISDVVSGIVLNFDHPYRIGDWIEPANSVIGKVSEITWRTTRLVTRDGMTVIVPNGLIATSRLINYSDPAHSYRVNLRLWLDSRLPVEQARKTLLMAALTAQRAYPGIRPDVLVQDVSEIGALYVVRFWVPDAGEENPCRDAVIAAILHGLQHRGIALASPKREVTWVEGDAGAALPALGPPTREQVVEECDLFRVFTPDVRASLALQLNERHFKKDDVVFARGAPGGTLFFVAEGALEVGFPGSSETRPTTTLDWMVPGDIFGEISFLTGEPRSATVTAMSDAVLYEVTKDAIESYLRQRPELFDRLAALMVERQKQNKIRMHDAEAANAHGLSDDDLASRIRAFFGFKRK